MGNIPQGLENADLPKSERSAGSNWQQKMGQLQNVLSAWGQQGHPSTASTLLPIPGSDIPALPPPQLPTGLSPPTHMHACYFDLFFMSDFPLVQVEIMSVLGAECAG